MKKFHWFILLSAVSLFTGCTVDGRIERREDKLIGAWVFDKAFYRAHNQVFRDDVYNDFAGDIIEFYGDYAAFYDDRSLNAVFPGNWEIVFTAGENSEFSLDMNFYDTIAEEPFGYFGAVTLLTENKLNMEVPTSRGVFTFRLRKID